MVAPVPPHHPARPGFEIASDLVLTALPSSQPESPTQWSGREFDASCFLSPTAAEIRSYDEVEFGGEPNC